VLCIRKPNREERKEIAKNRKEKLFTLGDHRILKGTPPAPSSYIEPNANNPRDSKRKGRIGERTMKEATDVLRVIGIILLGIFVLAVGIPLVLTAAGITLGILGILFGIAVMVIKLAVVIAIAYLVLVGVRAVLR
jgi:hypothetical protein